MPTVEKSVEQTLADLEQIKDILSRTLDHGAIERDLRQIADIIRHLENRVRATEFDFYIDPFDNESDVDQHALALAVLKKCETDCRVYALSTGQQGVKGIYQEIATELHTVINHLAPKLKPQLKFKPEEKAEPIRITGSYPEALPVFAFETAQENQPDNKGEKDNPRGE